MPKALDDIFVECIAETKVNRDAVRRWLDKIGATEFDIPPLEQVADPALLVALAAKQCYLSFQPGLNPNVTKVRKDMVEYLDNVLKQHHGSVLQHGVFTFAIDDCSRVFTGEMNRHTAGVAVSERSMRYIRYENISYWVPTIFQPFDGDDKRTAEKRRLSRKIMEQQFHGQEEAMKLFSEIWADELDPESSFHAKKVLTSAFRRIIGMGIATGGVWSLNIRALRHVIALRTDPSAEEEITHVCQKIGAHMLKALPELFGDFRVVEGVYVPQYWKV